ncbi:MAG: M48 family metallopeptidase [Chlamydiota bacterium]
MFRELIFLIIALLLISFAPEMVTEESIVSPTAGLALGLGLYSIVLGVIVLQNRLSSRYRSLNPLLLFFANSELIAFLAVFHYILGGHLFFLTTPKISQLLTIPILFSLFLYFGGLFVAFRTLGGSSCQYAHHKIRFLVPFILPFMTFQILADLYTIINPSKATMFVAGPLALIQAIVTIALFLVIIIVFFPPVLQYFWGCRPLKDSALQERLEVLCRKAHFKHAGFRVWHVMRHTFMAAIIGVAAPFRYIMFSKKLLNALPDNEIEAIVAHEIGHSRRHHLILYPLIFLGMITTIGLFYLLCGRALEDFFALHQIIDSGSFWKTIAPLGLFIPYIVIILLYFRLVFGFFSRNFERQADLHTFELGVDPQNLIDALDRIATKMGNIHHHYSWHHYGIQQRIDFLKKASTSSKLIEKHHLWVKRIIKSYLIILLAGTLVLVSPTFKDVPLLGSVGQWSEKLTIKFQKNANTRLRRQVARHYLKGYSLPGDPQKLLSALEKALLHQEALKIPGVLEFYAAQYLLKPATLPASAHLMIQAWQHFDFSEASPTALESFRMVSLEILDLAYKENLSHSSFHELKKIMAAGE